MNALTKQANRAIASSLVCIYSLRTKNDVVSSAMSLTTALSARHQVEKQSGSTDLRKEIQKVLTMWSVLLPCVGMAQRKTIVDLGSNIGRSVFELASHNTTSSFLGPCA
jgi:tRNA G46 methylase TrmB